MSERFDLIIHGAIAATPNGIARADIGIRDGRFAAIGEFDGIAAETFDARGLHALPGVIDTQVHFREPGMTHKEDLATGTAAAVLGGVTAVFEMPNTNPNTLSANDIADKVTRAKGRARCDIAFFVGAAAENAGDLAKTERSPGCAGVKVFMGSSTGSLLVPDDETLEAVLRSGFRRVAIHSEDEARLRERMHIAKESGDVAMHPVWRDEETAIRATKRVLKLARETGRRVHLLHVTTAEEMAILAGAKDIATVEATPQHLTLVAPDCYRELGTLAQMNPPIRECPPPRRAVASGARRGGGLHRLRPRPTYPGGKSQALSHQPLGDGGGADVAAAAAGSSGGGQADPGAYRGFDQRRPAADLQHRRQGPDCRGL